MENGRKEQTGLVSLIPDPRPLNTINFNPNMDK